MVKMALGIQIAGSLFGLFMIYYSFLNYKRKEFTIKELIFWISSWVIFMIIALFPSLLEPIVLRVGFLRALDLLTISGFFFLIAGMFYTYIITRKNQKQIEIIVRELAIKGNKRK